MQKALLAWYDRHRRVMPWRATAGQRPDPYHVWLSEIMLQQTTVATVGPYFSRFVARWPGVQQLAAASLDDVLAAWAGLGYYARARNLHACAKVVAKAGGFPETIDGLLALPGVGPYTAAAIASIAFDLPAVAVDGNVERVVARVLAIEEPLPAAKPLLRMGAAEIAAKVARPGDFTQAFMELGATICIPRNPQCGICPWQKTCRAYALGIQNELPHKTPKKARPVRYGHVYILQRADQSVLIEKREAKGLYGGMYQFPTSVWQSGVDTHSNGTDTKVRQEANIARKGLTGRDFAAIGEIRHILTHFELRLQVWHSTVTGTVAKDLAAGNNRKWVGLKTLEDYGIPTVMLKALTLVAPQGRRRNG